MWRAFGNRIGKGRAESVAVLMYHSGISVALNVDLQGALDAGTDLSC